MAIKVGMTVRAVRAVSGLAREGAVDLAEGAKGTVLAIDGDTAFLRPKGATEAVFVPLEALAGCKGRPMRAEGLVLALAAARGETTETATTAEAEEPEAGTADAETALSESDASAQTE